MAVFRRDGVPYGRKIGRGDKGVLASGTGRVVFAGINCKAQGKRFCGILLLLVCQRNMYARPVNIYRSRGAVGNTLILRVSSC